MNSGNSKTYDLHRPLPNLSNKIKLKRSNQYVASSILSIYYTWKNTERSYKSNLKYQLERGMINLNYLTDFILHQILKIILSMS